MSRTNPSLKPINKKDKDKKNTLSMTLDHNNMLKSLYHGKNDLTVTRTVKTTKAPPVRPFPGEVTLTKKTLIDTISYEDLQLEQETESRNRTGNKERLTAEDLMRDPEYLKIDQSKLALEMFDNIELEMLDKSPEEWVASKSNAQTPYYHSGEWIWRPVTVNSYNPATKEFEIHFFPNGITKHVKRLNLQFDEEDAEKFQQRRQVAEDSRYAAKQIMRLDYFIEKQPLDEIRVIRKDSIKKIHARIIDGLPTDVPFPEQDTRLGRLLRQLTGKHIRYLAYTKCIIV